MTRTMYDSTTPGRSIPAGWSGLILAYIDGKYTHDNANQAKAAFPNATIVTCSVVGTPGANVYDCEAGNLTPAGLARTMKAEVDAGRHPTGYCSASYRAQVDQAAAAVGLMPYQWEHLIAQYDGIAEIPPGCIGKQYQSNTTTNLDSSIVADYWPGVDPRLATTRYEIIGGDPDVATKITVSIPTDPDGSGNAAVVADVNKIISILVQGFDPQKAGTYWHDQGVSYTGTSDGNTILEVAGSNVKNGNVTVVAWVAA